MTRPKQRRVQEYPLLPRVGDSGNPTLEAARRYGFFTNDLRSTLCGVRLEKILSATEALPAEHHILKSATLAIRLYALPRYLSK